MLLRQPQDAPRRAHEDVGAGALQLFPVLLDGRASHEGRNPHFGKVLREAEELVLDLERQLTDVAKDEHAHLVHRCVNELEAGEHEDRRLSHARLRLAEDVGAENCLRDARVLHLGWMLEAALHDGLHQLGFQEEVPEARGADGRGVGRVAVGAVRVARAVATDLCGVIEVGELLLQRRHLLLQPARAPGGRQRQGKWGG
mmetsp:Transcript_40126/g.90570  ORF Transcript_40126/g.90570 Transcript_40126/m.90570 type:complete len:200 (-) Transcript_40126:19-618(-)